MRAMANSVILTAKQETVMQQILDGEICLQLIKLLDSIPSHILLGKDDAYKRHFVLFVSHSFRFLIVC